MTLIVSLATAWVASLGEYIVCGIVGV